MSVMRTARGRGATLLVASVGWALTGAPARAGLGPSPGTVSIHDATPAPGCDGVTDDTAAVTNALARAAGKTLYIPGGCHLLIHSPCADAEGSGSCTAGPYTSFTVPSGTTVQCQDATAGFTLARRKCTGGRYPGAHCTVDADCQGNATCGFETATPAARYANANPGTTFVLFRAAATSTDVTLENCAIHTHQADPYQRCAGGTRAGRPCRELCTGATPAAADLRCEDDASCWTGTCQNVADCTAAGGTCTGAPGSPGGAGMIDVIDFSAATHPVVRNVQIFDHFVGHFAINLGWYGFADANDTGRTVGDCMNATNTLVGALGLACYGAINNGANVNTQPLIAVTDGIVVTRYGKVTRNRARGVSAITATDAWTLLEHNTTSPDTATGPGRLPADFVGINATGAQSQVVGNRIGHTIEGNTGIRVGRQTTVANNTVTGGALYGIHLSGDATAIGNQVISDPIDTLQYGIVMDPGLNVADNYIVRPLRGGIWMKSGLSMSVTNNTLTGGARGAIRPIGIIHDGKGLQFRITGNHLDGFYHGIDGRTGSAFNTTIDSNRFAGIRGANITVGNAGVLIRSNYFNPGTGAHILSCGATCSNRGTVCVADADCTTCANPTEKCRAEPVITLGAVGGNGGLATQHAMVENNLIYDNRDMKQCVHVPSDANDGKDCTTLCTGGICPCTRPADCVPRQPPLLKVLDYGSGAHADDNISGNTFLLGAQANGVHAIDLSTLVTGLTLTGLAVLSNTFSAALGATDITAIAFPPTGPLVTNVNVDGNCFTCGAAPITPFSSWSPARGRIGLTTGTFFVGVGTGLGATTGFFPFSSRSRVSTPVTTVAERIVGGLTVYRMWCSLTAAPGTSSARTFTLTDDGVATTAACTIRDAGLTCEWTSNTTPFSIADRSLVAIQTTATARPAGADGRCVIYASVDY